MWASAGSFKMRMLQTTALVMVLVFGIDSVTQGAPKVMAAVDPSPVAAETNWTITDFSLPAELGHVQRTFQGAADQPRVILIQDAHAVADAQEHIFKIIRHFQDAYGIQTVALEGAAAELDSRIFRSFPDPDRLRETLEGYLKHADLPASVPAAVLGSENSLYYGLEDWEVYEKGIALYLKAMQAETGLLRDLDRKRQALEKQKQEIYSDKLKQVDAAWTRFEANLADFPDVLRSLAAVRPPAPGSELGLLFEEMRTGQQVHKDAGDASLRRLAEEVDGLIRRDEAAVPKEARMTFSGHYQDYVTGRETDRAFSLYLGDLIEEHRLPVERSALLQHLAARERRLRNLEGTKLLDEFRTYAAGVRESLIETEDQRALARESERLALLRKLAKLEMAHDEWARFAETHLFDGNLTNDFNLHVAFYRNAEQRDQEMFGNLLNLLNSVNERKAKSGSLRGAEGDEARLTAGGQAIAGSGIASATPGHGPRNDGTISGLTNSTHSSNLSTSPPSALLIAGGFHTRGLVRRFEEAGVSYALVMPRIDEFPETSPYRDQMRGQVPWAKYFEVKNGKVNLYDAFVRYMRDELVHLDRSGDAERGRRGEESSSPRLPVSPSPGLMLKSWRDQIIRDLAARGEIEKAGIYTRFIDEMTVGARSPRPVGEQDQGGETPPLQMERVREFLKGLKRLVDSNQLTEPNIMKLFAPAASTIAVLGNGPQLLRNGHSDVTAGLIPVTGEPLEISTEDSRSAFEEFSKTSDGRPSESRQTPESRVEIRKEKYQDFEKVFGFNQERLDALAEKFPPLAGLDPERVAKGYEEALGIARAELAKAVVKHPPLAGYDPEENLRPKMNMIRILGIEQKQEMKYLFRLASLSTVLLVQIVNELKKRRMDVASVGMIESIYRKLNKLVKEKTGTTAGKLIRQDNEALGRDVMPVLNKILNERQEARRAEQRAGEVVGLKLPDFVRRQVVTAQPALKSSLERLPRLIRDRHHREEIIAELQHGADLLTAAAGSRIQLREPVEALDGIGQWINYYESIYVVLDEANASVDGTLDSLDETEVGEANAWQQLIRSRNLLGDALDKLDEEIDFLTRIYSGVDEIYQTVRTSYDVLATGLDSLTPLFDELKVSEETRRTLRREVLDNLSEAESTLESIREMAVPEQNWAAALTYLGGSMDRTIDAVGVLIEDLTLPGRGLVEEAQGLDFINLELRDRRITLNEVVAYLNVRSAEHAESRDRQLDLFAHLEEAEAGERTAEPEDAGEAEALTVDFVKQVAGKLGILNSVDIGGYGGSIAITPKDEMYHAGSLKTQIFDIEGELKHQFSAEKGYTYHPWDNSRIGGADARYNFGLEIRRKESRTPPSLLKKFLTAVIEFLARGSAESASVSEGERIWRRKNGRTYLEIGGRQFRVPSRRPEMRKDDEDMPRWKHAGILALAGLIWLGVHFGVERLIVTGGRHLIEEGQPALDAASHEWDAAMERNRLGGMDGLLHEIWKAETYSVDHVAGRIERLDYPIDDNPLTREALRDIVDTDYADWGDYHAVGAVYLGRLGHEEDLQFLLDRAAQGVEASNDRRYRRWVIYAIGELARKLGDQLPAERRAAIQALLGHWLLENERANEDTLAEDTANLPPAVIWSHETMLAQRADFYRWEHAQIERVIDNMEIEHEFSNRIVPRGESRDGLWLNTLLLSSPFIFLGLTAAAVLTFVLGLTRLTRENPWINVLHWVTWTSTVIGGALIAASVALQLYARAASRLQRRTGGQDAGIDLSKAQPSDIWPENKTVNLSPEEAAKILAGGRNPESLPAEAKIEETAAEIFSGIVSARILLNSIAGSDRINAPQADVLAGIVTDLENNIQKVLRQIAFGRISSDIPEKGAADPLLAALEVFLKPALQNVIDTISALIENENFESSVEEILTEARDQLRNDAMDRLDRAIAQRKAQRREMRRREFVKTGVFGTAAAVIPFAAEAQQAPAPERPLLERERTFRAHHQNIISSLVDTMRSDAFGMPSNFAKVERNNAEFADYFKSSDVAFLIRAEIIGAMNPDLRRGRADRTFEPEKVIDRLSQTITTYESLVNDFGLRDVAGNPTGVLPEFLKYRNNRIVAEAEAIPGVPGQQAIAYSLWDAALTAAELARLEQVLRHGHVDGLQDVALADRIKAILDRTNFHAFFRSHYDNGIVPEQDFLAGRLYRAGPDQGAILADANVLDNQYTELKVPFQVLSHLGMFGRAADPLPDRIDAGRALWDRMYFNWTDLKYDDLGRDAGKVVRVANGDGVLSAWMMFGWELYDFHTLAPNSLGRDMDNYIEVARDMAREDRHAFFGPAPAATRDGTGYLPQGLRTVRAADYVLSPAGPFLLLPSGNEEALRNARTLINNRRVISGFGIPDGLDPRTGAPVNGFFSYLNQGIQLGAMHYAELRDLETKMPWYPDTVAVFQAFDQANPIDAPLDPPTAAQDYEGLGVFGFQLEDENYAPEKFLSLGGVRAIGLYQGLAEAAAEKIQAVLDGDQTLDAAGREQRLDNIHYLRAAAGLFNLTQESGFQQGENGYTPAADDNDLNNYAREAEKISNDPAEQRAAFIQILFLHALARSIAKDMGARLNPVKTTTEQGDVSYVAYRLRDELNADLSWQTTFDVFRRLSYTEPMDGVSSGLQRREARYQTVSGRDAVRRSLDGGRREARTEMRLDMNMKFHLKDGWLQLTIRDQTFAVRPEPLELTRLSQYPGDAGARIFGTPSLFQRNDAGLYVLLFDEGISNLIQVAFATMLRYAYLSRGGDYSDFSAMMAHQAAVQKDPSLLNGLELPVTVLYEQDRLTVQSAPVGKVVFDHQRGTRTLVDRRLETSDAFYHEWGRTLQFLPIYLDARAHDAYQRAVAGKHMSQGAVIRGLRAGYEALRREARRQDEDWLTKASRHVGTYFGFYFSLLAAAMTGMLVYSVFFYGPDKNAPGVKPADQEVVNPFEALNDALGPKMSEARGFRDFMNTIVRPWVMPADKFQRRWDRFNWPVLAAGAALILGGLMILFNHGITPHPTDWMLRGRKVTWEFVSMTSGLVAGWAILAFHYGLRRMARNADTFYLVRSGLNAWTQNPTYLAYLAGFLGVLILNPTAAGFTGFGIMTAGWMMIIFRERAELLSRAETGRQAAELREYARTTPVFVPGTKFIDRAVAKIFTGRPETRRSEVQSGPDGRRQAAGGSQKEFLPTANRQLPTSIQAAHRSEMRRLSGDIRKVLKPEAAAWLIGDVEEDEVNDYYVEIYQYLRGEFDLDADKAAQQKKMIQVSFQIFKAKEGAFDIAKSVIEYLINDLGFDLKVMDYGDKSKLLTVVYGLSRASEEAYARFRYFIGHLTTKFGLQEMKAINDKSKRRIVTSAFYVAQGRATKKRKSGIEFFDEAMGVLQAIFGIGDEELKALGLGEKIRLITAGYAVALGKEGGLEAFKDTLKHIQDIFGIGDEEPKALGLGEKIRLITAGYAVALGKEGGLEAFKDKLHELISDQPPQTLADKLDRVKEASPSITRELVPTLPTASIRPETRESGYPDIRRTRDPERSFPPRSEMKRLEFPEALESPDAESLPRHLRIDLAEADQGWFWQKAAGSDLNHMSRVAEELLEHPHDLVWDVNGVRKLIALERSAYKYNKLVPKLFRTVLDEDTFYWFGSENSAKRRLKRRTMITVLQAAAWKRAGLDPVQGEGKQLTELLGEDAASPSKEAAERVLRDRQASENLLKLLDAMTDIILETVEVSSALITDQLSAQDFYRDIPVNASFWKWYWQEDFYEAAHAKGWIDDEALAERNKNMNLYNAFTEPLLWVHLPSRLEKSRAGQDIEGHVSRRIKAIDDNWTPELIKVIHERLSAAKAQGLGEIADAVWNEFRKQAPKAYRKVLQEIEQAEDQAARMQEVVRTFDLATGERSAVDQIKSIADPSAFSSQRARRIVIEGRQDAVQQLRAKAGEQFNALDSQVQARAQELAAEILAIQDRLSGYTDAYLSSVETRLAAKVAEAEAALQKQFDLSDRDSTLSRGVKVITETERTVLGRLEDELEGRRKAKAAVYAERIKAIGKTAGRRDVTLLWLEDLARELDEIIGEAADENLVFPKRGRPKAGSAEHLIKQAELEVRRKLTDKISRYQKRESKDVLWQTAMELFELIPALAGFKRLGAAMNRVDREIKNRTAQIRRGDKGRLRELTKFIKEQIEEEWQRRQEARREMRSDTDVMEDLQSLRQRLDEIGNDDSRDAGARHFAKFAVQILGHAVIDFKNNRSDATRRYDDIMSYLKQIKDHADQEPRIGIYVIPELEVTLSDYLEEFMKDVEMLRGESRRTQSRGGRRAPRQEMRVKQPMAFHIESGDTTGIGRPWMTIKAGPLHYELINYFDGSRRKIGNGNWEMIGHGEGRLAGAAMMLLSVMEKHFEELGAGSPQVEVLYQKDKVMVTFASDFPIATHMVAFTISLTTGGISVFSHDPDSLVTELFRLFADDGALHAVALLPLIPDLSREQANHLGEVIAVYTAEKVKSGIRGLASQLDSIALTDPELVADLREAMAHHPDELDRKARELFGSETPNLDEVLKVLRTAAHAESRDADGDEEEEFDEEAPDSAFPEIFTGSSGAIHEIGDGNVVEVLGVDPETGRVRLRITGPGAKDVKKIDSDDDEGEDPKSESRLRVPSEDFGEQARRAQRSEAKHGQLFDGDHVFSEDQDHVPETASATELGLGKGPDAVSKREFLDWISGQTDPGIGSGIIKNLDGVGRRIHGRLGPLLATFSRLGPDYAPAASAELWGEFLSILGEKIPVLEKGLSEDEDVMPFLSAVVHNYIIDKQRVSKKDSHPSIDIIREDEGSVHALKDSISSGAPDPSESSVMRENLGLFYSYIGALSHRQKQIIKLYLSGKTSAEMAGLLGIDKITVRTHLSHAVTELKKLHKFQQRRDAYFESLSANRARIDEGLAKVGFKSKRPDDVRKIRRMIDLFLQGLPYADIAEDLDINPVTVRTSIHRLRPRLAGKDPEAFNLFQETRRRAKGFQLKARKLRMEAGEDPSHEALRIFIATTIKQVLENVRAAYRNNAAALGQSKVDGTVKTLADDLNQMLYTIEVSRYFPNEVVVGEEDVNVDFLKEQLRDGAVLPEFLKRNEDEKTLSVYRGQLGAYIDLKREQFNPRAPPASIHIVDPLDGTRDYAEGTSQYGFLAGRLKWDAENKLYLPDHGVLLAPERPLEFVDDQGQAHSLESTVAEFGIFDGRPTVRLFDAASGAAEPAGILDRPEGNQKISRIQFPDSRSQGPNPYKDILQQYGDRYSVESSTLNVTGYLDLLAGSLAMTEAMAKLWDHAGLLGMLQAMGIKVFRSRTGAAEAQEVTGYTVEDIENAIAKKNFPILSVLSGTHEATARRLLAQKSESRNEMRKPAESAEAADTAMKALRASKTMKPVLQELVRELKSPETATGVLENIRDLEKNLPSDVGEYLDGLLPAGAPQNKRERERVAEAIIFLKIHFGLTVTGMETPVAAEVLSPAPEVQSGEAARQAPVETGPSLIDPASALALLAKAFDVEFYVPASAVKQGWWSYELDVPDKMRQRIDRNILPAYNKRGRPSRLQLVFSGRRPVLLITEGISWSQLPDDVREENEKALLEPRIGLYLSQGAKLKQAQKQALKDFAPARKNDNLIFGYGALPLLTDEDQELFTKTSQWFERSHKEASTYSNGLFSAVPVASLSKPIVIFKGIYQAGALTSEVMRRGIRPRKGARVLVLGTGTGADAILSASKAGPEGRIVAADLDPLAVANAAYNVAQTPYQNLVQVVQGDLFRLEGLSDHEMFHHIYFNLPMEGGGEEGDIAANDPGRKLLSRLLAEAPDHLEEGGTLEITYGEFPELFSKLYQTGWEPAVIEGIGLSRERLPLLAYDYARFTLVRQKNKESRMQELTELAAAWEKLASFHKIIRAGRHLDDENQQMLRDIMRRHGADTFGDRLIVKAVNTLLRADRGQLYKMITPDVRINELYPEYAPHAETRGGEVQSEPAGRPQTADGSQNQFLPTADRHLPTSIQASRRPASRRLYERGGREIGTRQQARPEMRDEELDEFKRLLLGRVTKKNLDAALSPEILRQLFNGNPPPKSLNLNRQEIAQVTRLKETFIAEKAVDPASSWFDMKAWLEGPYAQAMEAFGHELAAREAAFVDRMELEQYLDRTIRRLDPDFSIDDVVGDGQRLDVDDVAAAVGKAEVEVIIPRGYIFNASAFVENRMVLGKILQTMTVQSPAGRSVPVHIARPATPLAFGHGVANAHYVVLGADAIEMDRNMIEEEMNGARFAAPSPEIGAQYLMKVRRHRNGNRTLEQAVDLSRREVLLEELSHYDVYAFTRELFGFTVNPRRWDKKVEMARAIIRDGSWLSQALDQYNGDLPGQVMFAESILELEGKMNALRLAEVPSSVFDEILIFGRIISPPNPEMAAALEQESYTYHISSRIMLDVLSADLLGQNTVAVRPWREFIRRSLEDLNAFDRRLHETAEAEYHGLFLSTEERRQKLARSRLSPDRLQDAEQLLRGVNANYAFLRGVVRIEDALSWMDTARNGNEDALVASLGAQYGYLMQPFQIAGLTRLIMRTVRGETRKEPQTRGREAALRVEMREREFELPLRRTVVNPSTVDLRLGNFIYRLGPSEKWRWPADAGESDVLQTPESLDLEHGHFAWLIGDLLKLVFTHANPLVMESGSPGRMPDYDLPVDFRYEEDRVTVSIEPFGELLDTWQWSLNLADGTVTVSEALEHYVVEQQEMFMYALAYLPFVVGEDADLSAQAVGVFSHGSDEDKRQFLREQIQRTEMRGPGPNFYTQEEQDALSRQLAASQARRSVKGGERKTDSHVALPGGAAASGDIGTFDRAVTASTIRSLRYIHLLGQVVRRYGLKSAEGRRASVFTRILNRRPGESLKAIETFLRRNLPDEAAIPPAPVEPEKISAMPSGATLYNEFLVTEEMKRLTGRLMRASKQEQAAHVIGGLGPLTSMDEVAQILDEQLRLLLSDVSDNDLSGRIQLILDGLTIKDRQILKLWREIDDFMVKNDSENRRDQFVKTAASLIRQTAIASVTHSEIRSSFAVSLKGTASEDDQNLILRSPTSPKGYEGPFEASARKGSGRKPQSEAGRPEMRADYNAKRVHEWVQKALSQTPNPSLWREVAQGLVKKPQLLKAAWLFTKEEIPNFDEDELDWNRRTLAGILSYAYLDQELKEDSEGLKNLAFYMTEAVDIIGWEMAEEFLQYQLASVEEIGIEERKAWNDIILIEGLNHILSRQALLNMDRWSRVFMGELTASEFEAIYKLWLYVHQEELDVINESFDSFLDLVRQNVARLQGGQNKVELMRLLVNNSPEGSLSLDKTIESFETDSASAVKRSDYFGHATPLENLASMLTDGEIISEAEAVERGYAVRSGDLGEMIDSLETKRRKERYQDTLAEEVTLDDRIYFLRGRLDENYSDSGIDPNTWTAGVLVPKNVVMEISSFDSGDVTGWDELASWTDEYTVAEPVPADEAILILHAAAYESVSMALVKLLRERGIDEASVQQKVETKLSKAFLIPNRWSLDDGVEFLIRTGLIKHFQRPETRLRPLVKDSGGQVRTDFENLRQVADVILDPVAYADVAETAAKTVRQEVSEKGYEVTARELEAAALERINEKYDELVLKDAAAEVSSQKQLADAFIRALTPARTSKQPDGAVLVGFDAPGIHGKTLQEAFDALNGNVPIVAMLSQNTEVDPRGLKSTRVGSLDRVRNVPRWIEGEEVVNKLLPTIHIGDATAAAAGNASQVEIRTVGTGKNAFGAFAPVVENIFRIRIAQATGYRIRDLEQLNDPEALKQLVADLLRDQPALVAAIAEANLELMTSQIDPVTGRAYIAVNMDLLGRLVAEHLAQTAVGQSA